MLLKSHPGSEVAAVRDILGEGVPVAGGYTLGQIVPAKDAKTPQLLNQHIVVVAFAEE
jgi:energy-converting hydrogenase Eha subunit B